MKKLQLILLMVLSMLIMVNGCKKDKTIIIDSQTTSAKDNGAAENVFADIKRVVEEAVNDEGQSNKSGAYSFGSCATITIAPAWADTTFPKVMEIDFGSTNCTGAYGINRRGKLVINISGRYIDSGSVLTVQPQNYYVNDVKVEGTKTLTNMGLNSNNHHVFSVEAVNGQLTYTDGTVTTWSSTRENEWIEGDTTNFFTDGLAGICDDVYLITGSANGVNRNGLAYSVDITSPLRKEICCRWISSGTLEIVPSGLATRYVDFGSGACDAQATITINGNIFTVYMF